MHRANLEPVAIAILAKAPVPGFAKTRLGSILTADGAAELQARFIKQAVATASAADVGPVFLWADPDAAHPIFGQLAADHRIVLRPQSGGDLGARMLAALSEAGGSALVIGVDCPALTAEYLRVAADVLRDGADAVLLPAEDGGYVLIGMRTPQPDLFSTMTWSADNVACETRRRMARLGLCWREPARLWDVDVPADLQRLHREGFGALLNGLPADAAMPAY